MEGYNACYRIISARLFFRAITQALGEGYHFLGSAPIVYADKFDFRDARSHAHPALVKGHTAFSGQAEIRAIWVPVISSNVAPVILKASEAKHYAMTHKIL